MKHAAPFLLALLVLLTGCQTEEEKAAVVTRTAMNDAIKNEPAGNYYVGRRYYKVDYKFWGYIRKPGQPWNTSKLVMMNEQKVLAPDRAKGTLGSDHGYEYKISGDYSGQTVYEPASNSFYPEFVATKYELISATPPPIILTPGANDPQRRIIEAPH